MSNNFTTSEWTNDTSGLPFPYPLLYFSSLFLLYLSPLPSPSFQLQGLIVIVFDIFVGCEANKGGFCKEVI